MSAATSTARPQYARPQQAAQPGRLLGLGIMVLAFTLLPYLCGYLLSPPGQSFLGALNNIGDLTQYLAAIRQGATGAWRYTNQFTPDQARPLLMYAPYLLAGHTSFGLAPTAVFQLLRLACAGLCLWALAQFCRLFLGAYALRAAWLFTLLAGGLYWMALLLSGLGLHLVDPPSLTAPELNPFITILISPHESLGLAAELMGFVSLLRAAGAVAPIWVDSRKVRLDQAERAPRQALFAAFWFLVLALSYPFLLPTVGLVGFAAAVIAARSTWRSRLLTAAPKRTLRAGVVFTTEMRVLALALCPAGLVGLYYLRIFHSDPLWSHSGLAQVGRPDLAVLLFAFGPLAVGAYAGTRRLQSLRRAGSDEVPAAWAWFPLIWSLANTCTLLLPIWQQGRQALGLTVPLALLTFLALAGPGSPTGAERSHLPLAPAGLLAFSAPLLLALYTAVTAGGVNQNYYTPQAVAQAVTWLGNHAEKNDVVLSSAGFGNLVPVTCTCRVVIGQNFQSFDWAVRQHEVYAFYSAASPSAARRILRGIEQREHVTYIVYSPYERGLVDRDPLHLSVLRLRYRAHDVSIYDLRPVRHRG